MYQSYEFKALPTTRQFWSCHLLQTVSGYEQRDRETINSVNHHGHNR
jgi:hypothetical protein